MKVGEMAVKRINDWINFFYIEAADFNYGSVVLHKAKKAIVFDTMDCVANGKRVKDYMHNLGIDHFTVVNTHWHFDHIGGNSVYQDDNIIATSKSRQRMEQNKKLIETGGKGEVGKDPGDVDTIDFIETPFPVVYPNIIFDDRLELYLNNHKIELFNIHIHTRDCLVCYIPEEKILIPGDTLEAPLPLIIEVGHLPTHIKNLKKLKQMDIEIIIPLHGNLERYDKGGYDISFIDNTINYLTKVLSKVNEPDFLEGNMEEYITKAVEPRESYRNIHRDNLALVQQYYKK
ncbi:MAG: MBL fold metallo-hydrolase [Desulfobacterales bacterium]|jgi:glyoxylase-like metal-dependent hydrolase (beta-lactamase superfamily II)